MVKKNPWDRLAGDYDKCVGDSGDLYHKIYLNPLMLKLIGNVKNKKVLDLACGNGYFSNFLVKKKAVVTGVDYSKELIAIAKKRSDNNIKFFVGSSSNMKFLKDNSFDLIISNLAFHDIREISKTIKECSRLIKSKHKLIFSITHPVFSLSERNRKDNDHYQKIKKYMSIIAVDHPCYKGVKHYHRPIEYFMKVLFKNKFVISGFHEIAIKHGNGKIIKDPRELAHKLEIPTFLIIEATSVK